MASLATAAACAPAASQVQQTTPSTTRGTTTTVMRTTTTPSRFAPTVGVGPDGEEELIEPDLSDLPQGPEPEPDERVTQTVATDPDGVPVDDGQQMDDRSEPDPDVEPDTSEWEGPEHEYPDDYERDPDN